MDINGSGASSINNGIFIMDSEVHVEWRESLRLLGFPSPQLRQQTRLPKFQPSPVARMLTLMTMLKMSMDVLDHKGEQHGVELIDEAEDGLPVLEPAYPFALGPLLHPSTTRFSICQT